MLGELPVLAATLVGAIFTIIERVLSSRRDDKSDEKIAHAIDAIKADPNDFGNLLDFNRSLIDRYHRGTRQRATWSFVAAMVAMIVGLGVVVNGAFVVFGAGNTGLSTDQKIVAAAFCTVVGAISGFIAKTFIETHREALKDLSSYFRQPLITGYLLSAERIATSVPGNHDELFRVLDCTLAIATSEAGGNSAYQEIARNRNARPTNRKGRAGAAASNGKAKLPPEAHDKTAPKNNSDQPAVAPDGRPAAD